MEESNRSLSTDEIRDCKYIVLRMVNGCVEYLYAINPWLWTPRKRMAYRFKSAKEADRATRGIGWRFIQELYDYGRARIRSSSHSLPKGTVQER